MATLYSKQNNFWLYSQSNEDKIKKIILYCTYFSHVYIYIRVRKRIYAQNHYESIVK